MPTAHDNTTITPPDDPGRTQLSVAAPPDASEAYGWAAHRDGLAAALSVAADEIEARK